MLSSFAFYKGGHGYMGVFEKARFTPFCPVFSYFFHGTLNLCPLSWKSIEHDCVLLPLFLVREANGSARLTRGPESDSTLLREILNSNSRQLNCLYNKIKDDI